MHRSRFVAVVSHVRSLGRRAVPASGGGAMGDLAGFSKSQLAVLPGTADFIPPGSGVLDRAEWLLAMVPPSLDAPTPEAEPSA